MNERLTLQAGCLALLAAVLWGGMNVSVKIALTGIPPFALAGIRFVIGALVVFIWALLIGEPLKLNANERQGLIQLALLFVLQIGVLYLGIHFTLAGRARRFSSTTPCTHPGERRPASGAMESWRPPGRSSPA